MTTPSQEHADKGTGSYGLWVPSLTFIIGLMGGLGLGVLGSQSKLAARAERAAGITAPEPPPPPGPPEEGRTLRIEGFDQARAVVPKPEARALPKPTPVRVLMEGKAEYPEFARRARLEGPVDVTVTVDEQGLPTTCTASGGNRVLTQAALDAASAWRFEPATRLGRSVPGTFRIHFDFRLHPKPVGEVGA